VSSAYAKQALAILNHSPELLEDAKAGLAEALRSASSCRRMARRKVSSMNAVTSACVRGLGVLRVRTGGNEAVDGRVFVQVME
jgi:hypothetical protein